jgi:hypothetical protein
MQRATKPPRLGRDDPPRPKSIQRLHVANELRRQLLMFYDGLRNPSRSGSARSDSTIADARSPIDDSNFAVGRLQIQARTLALEV